MRPARFVAMATCLVAGMLLAGCGVKDDPDPPSGKRNVPPQIYPKPDAMPGAPAASPAPPPARRS